MNTLFRTSILLLVLTLSSCGDEPVENPTVFTVNQVGASGFDLVSYFTEESPIQGSAEIYVTKDEVNYFFASEENKSLFETNPEQYLPAYGGWCAYAMANDGSLMSSNPDKYEIQDGKLYLFFDNFITSIQGGLQKEWNSDPDTYKTIANDNWDEHLRSIY